MICHDISSGTKFAPHCRMTEASSPHPRELDAADVSRFLSSLATDRHVSASTQNQALSALLFLYRIVLGQPLPPLPTVERVRTPARLPVVLTRTEVRALLGQLAGVSWLVAALLYGAGLRLLECLELRVKAIDHEQRQITIRQGKGRKDRVTMLPSSVAQGLTDHLGRVWLRLSRSLVSRWLASTARPRTTSGKRGCDRRRAMPGQRWSTRG